MVACYADVSPHGGVDWITPLTIISPLAISRFLTRSAAHRCLFSEWLHYVIHTHRHVLYKSILSTCCLLIVAYFSKYTCNLLNRYSLAPIRKYVVWSKRVVWGTGILNVPVYWLNQTCQPNTRNYYSACNSIPLITVRKRRGGSASIKIPFWWGTGISITNIRQYQGSTVLFL